MQRKLHMAKKVLPLTDTQTKKAKASDKDYKLFDGGGLFLLVTKSGGKLWRLKYLFDGKEKLISIGTYPEVSISQARAKRERFKSDVAKGIDPSAERKEIKQAKQTKKQESKHTFENCASDYFKMIEDKISEGHYNKQWGRLKSNVIPFIGDKLMNDIKRDEILQCLTRIQERGAIEEAHRVYNIITQVYQYAVANERCERNTSADISPKWTLKPIVKTNYPTITDPDEIGKLLNAIDIYKGEYSVRCALQIMPYLALRPFNIRAMEWSEVDLENSILTLPSDKMKMRREHLVPLVPKVVEILRDLKKLTGAGRYCFGASRTRNSPLSENTLRSALIRLGYSSDEIVPHGFRAMFSTIANELRHGDDKIIEKCLAHEEKNKVKSSYNRAQYWKQRIELMQWWADYLDGLKAKEMLKQ